MSSSERTQTPWRVTDNTTSTTIRADQHSKGKPIAEIWENGDNRSANAAFIVEAVNAHDKLVEALEIASNSCNDVTELGRFSPSVDPVSWVAQLKAHIDAALSLAKSEKQL